MMCRNKERRSPRRRYSVTVEGDRKGTSCTTSAPLPGGPLSRFLLRRAPTCGQARMAASSHAAAVGASDGRVVGETAFRACGTRRAPYRWC